jgi:hypothetical protein
LGRLSGWISWIITLGLVIPNPSRLIAAYSISV